MFAIENYTSFSFIRLCTRTDTKGILASKNMLNGCILYALSTRAYYVTSGINFHCEKVHEDDIFE